jgi:hypothetical protein
MPARLRLAAAAHAAPGAARHSFPPRQLPLPALVRVVMQNQTPVSQQWNRAPYRRLRASPARTRQALHRAADKLRPGSAPGVRQLKAGSQTAVRLLRCASGRNRERRMGRLRKVVAWLVENNLLGGNEDTQTKFVQEHGKNIASCADNPGSASCQKGLAMQDALMVALPAGLGGGLLAAATPEIAVAAQAAIQSCAGNVVLCLNNAGIQVSEAIVPGGVGAGGAVGIGKTAAEATAAKAEAAAANVAKNGQTINNSSSLNVAEQIGILRDAAKGNKGYFGLGKATANEANVLGEAWVGPGYRISKDGTSWVSADGLRVYRPPSAKPNSTYATTGVQANFEQKLTPGGRPISNGHLDITK